MAQSSAPRDNQKAIASGQTFPQQEHEQHKYCVLPTTKALEINSQLVEKSFRFQSCCKF
jgi:hypothetical protein